MPYLELRLVEHSYVPTIVHDYARKNPDRGSRRSRLRRRGLEGKLDGRETMNCDQSSNNENQPSSGLRAGAWHRALPRRVRILTSQLGRGNGRGWDLAQRARGAKSQTRGDFTNPLETPRSSMKHAQNSITIKLCPNKEIT